MPATPAKSDRTEEIFDSILDAVGETPVVRLKRIARDLPCEVLAKCEY